MNVTARLREVARERPDAPAIIAGQAIDGVPEGRTISYAELDGIVDAIAQRAARWGLGAGDRVNLLLKAHFALLALKLGCARAGIATCGIDVPDGAAARVVPHDDGSAPGGRNLVVDPRWWTDAADAPAPMHPGGDALFMLQATSGTTGVAKAVPVTHAMLLARARVADACPHPREVRLLCTSGPGGGYGLRHMMRVLDAGGSVVLADSSADITALVERHRVNMLVTSPHAVSLLLERRARDAPRLATLEQLSIGGSLLSGELVRTVAERVCATVLCTYGSTEAGATAVGPGSAMRGLEGAAGFVLPGVTVEALGDDDRPLPAGRTGRLRIRAPGQAPGYHADPAATALFFRDGWFHPGDLGTVTEDGILVIGGRIDDLINVGGSKFAPEIIERVLLRVPGVRDAAAFGVRDALGKHVLHAAIVVDGTIDVATIEATFKAHRGVPPPAVVLRVPQLPRDSQGKIGRRALATYVASRRRGLEPDPPA